MEKIRKVITYAFRSNEIIDILPIINKEKLRSWEFESRTDKIVNGSQNITIEYKKVKNRNYKRYTSKTVQL